MTPSASTMRDGWVITVEDWAEVRRLYLAERMSIKAIAAKLHLARNTVRGAVRANCPFSREPAIHAPHVKGCTNTLVGMCVTWHL